MITIQKGKSRNRIGGMVMEETGEYNIYTRKNIT